MIASALTGLTALIDRGKLAEAAEEVRRLWSSAREPALAELLARFPKRALPLSNGAPRGEHWISTLRWGDALLVPALLTELEAMLAEEGPPALIPCLRALASYPGDPRVGAACLRWVLDPSKVRAPNAAIFQELEKALTRHLDRRHGETLKALAQTDSPWSEKIGRAVALPVLSRLADHGDTLLFHRAPLPADVAQRLEDLAERVSQMRLDSVTPEAIEKGLLRIRHHPLDEAARAVFRDLLLEASDPWGELIVLQEARAAKGDTQASNEERQLLRRVELRILGALTLHRAGMIVPLEYRRGFLAHAAIHAHAHDVAAVMAHAELSTLERVTFENAAAITDNLVALKEAYGVTLADLERARQQAPAVKLSVVAIKDVSVAELVGTRWWPELRELYTFDPRPRLEQLLTLPVSPQLTAVGVLERPAATAFEGFDVAMLAGAPSSIQRVRIDAFGRRETLQVTWVRNKPGWKAEVSGSTSLLPRPDRADAPELRAALPALRRHLKGARSVVVMPGVSSEIRQAIEKL